MAKVLYHYPPPAARESQATGGERPRGIEATKCLPAQPGMAGTIPRVFLGVPHSGSQIAHSLAVISLTYGGHCLYHSTQYTGDSIIILGKSVITLYSVHTFTMSIGKFSLGTIFALYLAGCTQAVT